MMMHYLEKKNTCSLEMIAGIVRAIHVAFIAWMIYAPFSGIDEFLVMHAITVPFLIAHWLTSADGCFLTLLEKRVRGLDSDDKSFIYKIVRPLYVIDDASLRTLVILATLALWSVTLSKLSMATVRRVLWPFST